jgi:hypothetical protein
MTDQPQTAVFFSHAQGPTLVNELSAILGPALFTQQSSEWVLSLDRAKINLPYLSGLLGDRGWEMVGVETRLQAGAMMPGAFQTNWYFKRPVE